jgi:hypothetical protein
MLLQWLTYHHQQVTGTNATVENFGDDLSDGTVFASVLTAYAPYLAAAFFSDIFTLPQDEEHKYAVLRYFFSIQNDCRFI